MEAMNFKGVYDRWIIKLFCTTEKCQKVDNYKRLQEDFDWIYQERDNDQIVISNTSKFIQLINSYVASDSSFSISSITDEFWYAGTFDLVKNNEDLLRVYQKNKSTYCGLMKEKIILESTNLELQYNNNDFIDFNNRNNINC